MQIHADCGCEFASYLATSLSRQSSSGWFCLEDVSSSHDLQAGEGMYSTKESQDLLISPAAPLSTITVGSVLAAGCYQSCSASGSSHRCGYWLILTSPVPYIRFGLGWRDASGLSVGHALALSPTSMWPKPVIQLCSPVLYWLPAKVLPCVLCCVISMLFAFRSTAERDGCSKAKGC